MVREDFSLEERNPDLYNRLLNFKFEQASHLLDDEPEKVVKLVNALTRAFGNSGWFDGDLAVIVGYALANIGITDDSTIRKQNVR